MTAEITAKSMQISETHAGCIPGGIRDAISKIAQDVVNPDGAAAVCDPMFRKALHAEVLERISTIWVPFVSSTPAAAGGDLILTPTTFGNQLVALEWFKNGIQYPAAASDPLATSVAPTVGQLLPGEAAPWALTFADTDGLTQSSPPSNGYDFDADLVAEENQDYACWGMSVEPAGIYTAEAGTNGIVRRKKDAFLDLSGSAYASRLYRAVYSNIALRLRFVEGGDTRNYRMGPPMGWPSYTGFFGWQGVVNNGQPQAFMFKDWAFGLQMNKRPRLTGNSRVRIFADLPAQINVPNNAAVPVPANLSDIGQTTSLRGYVFVGLKLRLYGSTMCIRSATGQSTEVQNTNFQAAVAQAVAEVLRQKGLV